MATIRITRTCGTAYFPTRVAAAEYYEPYNPDLKFKDLFALIDRKIKDGEIHIGRPDTKLGERVRLVDEKPGRRYYIEEFTPIL